MARTIGDRAILTATPSLMLVPEGESTLAHQMIAGFCYPVANLI
jgi:hypothetical protein